MATSSKQQTVTSIGKVAVKEYGGIGAQRALLLGVGTVVQERPLRVALYSQYEADLVKAALSEGAKKAAETAKQKREIVNKVDVLSELVVKQAEHIRLQDEKHSKAIAQLTAAVQQAVSGVPTPPVNAPATTAPVMLVQQVQPGEVYMERRGKRWLEVVSIDGKRAVCHVVGGRNVNTKVEIVSLLGTGPGGYVKLKNADGSYLGMDDKLGLSEKEQKKLAETSR